MSVRSRDTQLTQQIESKEKTGTITALKWANVSHEFVLGLMKTCFHKVFHWDFNEQQVVVRCIDIQLMKSAKISKVSNENIISTDKNILEQFNIGCWKSIIFYLDH